MAVVLSYGFINPSNGDTGGQWFPALNTNIQKLNDHTHNGTNSALINASYIVSGTVSILAANWVADGTGRYKQVVTCPAGFNMDSHNLLVRLTSNGNIIYPSIEKTTTSTFTIYTLDSSLAYTAVFR